MNSILVIDDDIELCELLGDYLGAEGFAVDLAHDGAAGVELALGGRHDLVVLDVMLPGMNGLDVLRAIRAESTVPVLMLTARGEEVDRIVGLELGADDYLPKPFNPRELVARIRAVQRRAGGPAENRATPPAELRLGDLVLQPASRRVLRAGRQISLTSVEFTLLHELARQAGNVVSREHLAETVLGRKLALFDRSIDVHVSSLRKKLGNQSGRERIRSVRGVGYQYLLPDGEADA